MRLVTLFAIFRNVTPRPTARSRGQVLLLYAFGMTFLLGMVALALDVSIALTTKREYQKVAAVCAVVGAQRFPAPVPSPTPTPDPAPVKTAAQTCVTNNLPSVSATANIPPQSGTKAGDSTFVEVILDKPQQTFFASIFGINAFNALTVGRAVAGGFLPIDFAMMS